MTRPQYGSCSMGVASKMAARSGGNSKSTGSRAEIQSSNKSPEPPPGGPATSEHKSVLLRFKFPASEKYDAILDSFVTTTLTVHVPATKASFDVIMHKVNRFRALTVSVIGQVITLTGLTALK